MSCRRARRRVLEYVFDELERPDRADFESHLDSCPPCRRRVSALRHVWRALPEPHPAGLEPPPEAWKRSWETILGGIADLPVPQTAAGPPWLATGLRWSSAAAALCAAFALGHGWDDLKLEAMHLAGLEPPAPAGYFAGLDSFQRASGDYLQRSRLLLLELQQTGAAARGLDDPLLIGHSKLLLGEFPRQYSAARSIHNPQLERLLADLERVLRDVLERTGRGGVEMPPGLEAELGGLLFKLEMLELPETAASAPGAPAAL